MPNGADNPAELLAWASRVRSAADVARHQALALRHRVDQRGLSGPAGDALAQAGEAAAAQMTASADHARAAADALVQAAHEAALAAAEQVASAKARVGR